MKNDVDVTNQEESKSEIIASAGLSLFDREDGTMEVQVQHSGDFDPAFQSHAVLRAISQALPHICRPAGIDLDGTIGRKMPISDAERYAAIRELAFIPETERLALLATVMANMGEPSSSEQYDAFADQLVLLGRINPKPNEAGAIAESAPKIVGTDGHILQ